MPPGTLTFLRQSVQTSPKWQDLGQPLGRLRSTPIGTIEDDGAGMSQMDFANEYIGGGVLGSGCVQVCDRSERVLKRSPEGQAFITQPFRLLVL